jgi:ABC-type branched-subunit amino acid transport system permease subunit
MIGMWLMYERTKDIVIAIARRARSSANAGRDHEAIGTQIFGVVGGAEIPVVWAFADSLIAQLALVVLVPGLLALVFGWLAFRSRVTGVYLSILTQAMTLALSLYLFQNDTGLRGNNGLSGLQNIPGLTEVPQDRWCRSGSSGPRRWRWGWAIWSLPGWCRASSAIVIAASATTRRACGSSAIRWRPTSWWCSR